MRRKLRKAWPVLIVVFMTACVIFADGCAKEGGQPGGSKTPAGCDDPTINIMLGSVDNDPVYVCDGTNNKLHWQFDTTSIASVKIDFTAWPFNGPAHSIVSSQHSNSVDSPPMPKKTHMEWYKYSIEITPKSGSNQTLDPHVVSGGGLVHARD